MGVELRPHAALTADAAGYLQVRCDAPAPGIGLMSSAPDGPPVAVGELALIVLAEQPLEKVLDRITGLATATIHGVHEASITLLRDEHAHTAAFSGEVALQLGERQYETGYGPCLDAAQSGDTVEIPDTFAGTGYPDFSRRAHELGVKHTLSVGLPTATGTFGALNLYGRDDGPFAPEAAAEAIVFARYAAVAMINAVDYSDVSRLAFQMQQAMQSRAVIEQAKGVLMRDNHCSPDDAMKMLITASNRSNRKLRDVAHGLVESVQRGR